ncbi:unnamed protein product [marine sediment metagenome]|uniref:Uncharacterized protein n=1 Tax=marine sediment metagenome TaxID=412755 RepID=X1KZ80_9ZZZZ
MNTTNPYTNFIDSRLSQALVWQVYYRQGIRFAEIPDRIIRISQGAGKKCQKIS